MEDQALANVGKVLGDDGLDPIRQYARLLSEYHRRSGHFGYSHRATYFHLTDDEVRTRLSAALALCYDLYSTTTEDNTDSAQQQ